MDTLTGKTLIFTDQHLGLKANSESRLKIAIAAFKSVMQYAKANDIKNVISLGDMFHSRSQIDVNVLNVGYKLMQALAKYCRVWLIVGNHDQYLKNSTSVNSIKIFQDIPNVTLVDKPMELNINGNLALLVPWSADLTAYSKEQYDLLFGHFDVSEKFIRQTFIDENKNVLGKPIEKDETTSFVELVKPNSPVFSGHIHIRKEMWLKDRKLIFVGSPYQQTLADVGCKCGFYVLSSGQSYQFIEIKNVPHHIELKMSELVQPNCAFDFELVRGNIVHKIYDVEVDPVSDAQIAKKINEHSPYEQLLPDYQVRQMIENDELTQANAELLKKSKLQYIQNYVQNLDDDALKTENIDKDKLLDTLKTYYARCEG